MKVYLRAVKDSDEILKAEFKRLKKPYAEEKPALEPRRPKIKAQKEMFDYWDKKWNTMVESMKKEIEAVLEA